MSKQQDFVLKGLHIIAWIIFVGLCVEAGGVIVNFVFSLLRPDFVQNLYNKLDLSTLFTRNKWAFFSMYSFIIAIALLKVRLFYTLILLTKDLNLNKPFSPYVSKQISKLSYYTLSIGFLSFLANQSAHYLQKHGYEIHRLNEFWDDSQAFILMGAVIYVIATIFSKGLEFQNENDLTV